VDKIKKTQMPIFLSHLKGDYKKEITLDMCKCSNVLMSQLQDCEEDEPELFLDTPKELIEKVLEFLAHHACNPLREIQTPIKTSNIADLVDEWDSKFIDVDNKLLVDLINVADYIDCSQLTELSDLKLACLMYEKIPDEIRETFNIEKETPSEAAKTRDENMWLLELEN
jgi:S-phase kinase-associated protein 1